MVSPLRVPIAPFSHHHLLQQCFRPDCVRASPVDLLAFVSLFSALFPIVFCSYLFSLLFGFDFSLYCSFSICFVCVLFLQFCRSPPRLFRHPPPTVGFLPRPPRQASNAPFNGRGLLEHNQFSLYFLFACICFFFFPVFLLCFCL